MSLSLQIFTSRFVAIGNGGTRMRLFSSTFRKIWLLLQAGFVACMLAALVMQPGVASAHSATSAAPGPSLNAAPTNCPTFPGEPKRQLRGVWIATVANIDWPSQPGLPAATQQQEYINLLDQAQHMGLNAVFVQVRPAADAFYPSQYAPWSQ